LRTDGYALFSRLAIRASRRPVPDLLFTRGALVDDELRRGVLSYSKARAITRVADASNEAVLLGFARHSTAGQLEKICRLYRQVTTAVPTTARQVADREAQRWVRARDTEDGMVQSTIQLPTDEAQEVLKAMEAASRETERGRLVDGAVGLAQNQLSGKDGVRQPTEVVVHVSFDDGLFGGEVGDGHTEDGRGVPAGTARRLLCDPGVVPLVEDATGKTLKIGRKTRTIPPSIRRALAARDSGCRFPGCGNTRWTQAHHVVHWTDGGDTSLQNLITLCGHHHRWLHEYGGSAAWSESSPRQPVFTDPAGHRIPAVGVAPPVTPAIRGWLETRADNDEVAIDAHTRCCGWDGNRVDYSACIDDLFLDKPTTSRQAY
jgi:hypothetical protein